MNYNPKNKKDTYWSIFIALQINLILSLIFLYPLLSSYLIVVLLLTAAYVAFHKNMFSTFKRRINSIILLSGLYWVNVFWLLGTDVEHLNEGIGRLEKYFSLIIFPLIFSILPITRNQVYIVLYSLLACITLIIIYYCFDIYVLQGHQNKNEFITCFNEALHRTYVILYVLTCGFIAFISCINKDGKLYDILAFVILAFLIVITYFFESRIGLLAIIFLSLFCFFYIESRMKKIILCLLFVIGVGVVFFFVEHHPSWRTDMYVKKYKRYFSDNEKGYYPEDRIYVWSSVWHLVKDNFFFGVGTGDGPEAVNKSIREIKTWTSTDPHNQYLDIWIRQGIVGLLIFIFTLFYPLARAIKQKNYPYIIFLFNIIFFSLTESILNRQLGMVFYAVFNTLFYFNMEKVAISGRINS